MRYDTSVDYVNSFINFEKIPRYDYTSSFRLERMHAFLQELGNPHIGLNVIHVAGSKGKGSTCAIMASLLKEAGYCVGLYTSPHLLDTRERIRVLTRDSSDFEDTIEKEEFVELVERLRPVAEKFRDHKELGKLSFFEILTACAFLYFREKRVDFAILETGLGGRLDATNVIEPLVCGITNISLEHTDKLGNSLEAIAREKAGIIKAQGSRLKAQGVVVSASQEKEVKDVIREVCREKKVRLHEIGRDIKYSIVKSDENGQIFNLDGPGYSYKDLQSDLLGRHQVGNASLAIGMLMSINKDMLKIEEKMIRAGLGKVFWPGRMQIVQKGPYLILDGAQNAASIKRVLSSIKEILCYNRFICIFGISSDKDIKGVTRELDKASDIVILTKSRNERAKEPVCLKENFSRAHIDLTDSVEEALRLGLKTAGKEDLILVTGSLYVVGEALQGVAAKLALPISRASSAATVPNQHYE